MINIYTLADMRGDVNPDYNEDTPFVKVEDVRKIIEEFKEQFGARPKADEGEPQDRFISYQRLKKEFGFI